MNPRTPTDAEAKGCEVLLSRLAVGVDQGQPRGETQTRGQGSIGLLARRRTANNDRAPRSLAQHN